MTTNPFKKASKSQSRLRLGLVGVSGSGKTFSALAIGTALAAHYNGRVALIDTEHGSASKYADRFSFDVLELTDFNPQNYIDAIKAAAEYYDVLVIDSLSHAWSGSGGVLEMVDSASKRSQSNNKFTAWRDVTPLHNQLIEAIVGCPIHLIATMRSKTEYVLQPDERGKMTPTKVGMAPVQRDGMEYEFDVVGDLDAANTLIVSKSRISVLSGKIIQKPGVELADTLFKWLTDGKPIHWALNGGGAKFIERMKALNLPSDYVLAFLEPDRAIERLSEITFDEAAALARLDELAAQRNDVPTPPPASPQASPAPNDVSVEPDPLAEFGMENGATVITATDPREAVSDDDPNVRHVDHVIISRSKGATQVAFAIVNSRNRIPVIGEANISKLTDLFVGDTHIMALTIGTHELVPTWKVYADHDKDGWHIHKIETGIPVNGVTE